VLAALVEMISELVYEKRRLTVERSRDLKEAAAMHRRIYSAVRDHDAARAREEMTAHLAQARESQAAEEPARPRRRKQLAQR
jgi:GntR family transcriptional repressor for pyruvate dehydrogenase complex